MLAHRTNWSGKQLCRKQVIREGNIARRHVRCYSTIFRCFKMKFNFLVSNCFNIDFLFDSKLTRVVIFGFGSGNHKKSIERYSYDKMFFTSNNKYACTLQLFPQAFDTSRIEGFD